MVHFMQPSNFPIRTIGSAFYTTSPKFTIRVKACLLCYILCNSLNLCICEHDGNNLDAFFKTVNETKAVRGCKRIALSAVAGEGHIVVTCEPVQKQPGIRHLERSR